MPQSVTFAIPFPSLINPEVEVARLRNLDWAQARELVRSEAGLRELASWDLAQAVARTYPYAARDDLSMLVNWFSFAFLFDDQFNGGPDGRSSQVTAVAREMMSTPFRPEGMPPDHACPITCAWADLWPLVRRGMSETWCMRFAGNWARYMDAHVREVRMNAEGVLLGLEDFLALRRLTVGMHPCFDLIERAHGREVPPQLMAHRVVRELENAAAETIAFMNDVQSLEREERLGEDHNLVFVLQRDLGMTRADALDEAIVMTCERLDEVKRLLEEIPGLCDAMGLDEEEREAVAASTEGIAIWIRGNYDWAMRSGRYAEGHEEIQGYVDDLLVPVIPAAHRPG